MAINRSLSLLAVFLVILLCPVDRSLPCDHFGKVVDQILPTLEIDRVYNMTEAGQTVIINVTLRNVPGNGCGGWALKLTWNPDIAKLTTEVHQGPIPENQYVVLTEGPFLKSVGPTYFIVQYADNDIGEAVIGSILQYSYQGKNASGTGVILMMNFTIVKPGTTALESSPPFPSFNQSIITDAGNHMMDHVDTNGWITERKEESADYNAIIVMLAFDSTADSPKWNSEADLNNDDIVDIFDAIIVASN